MNVRTSISACSLLCMGLIAAPVGVHAASVDVEVTATLADGCTFSLASPGATQSLLLGMVHPFSTTDFSASKAFKYRCSAGSAYTISLGSDANSIQLQGQGQTTRSMELVLSRDATVPKDPQSALLPYTLGWTAPPDLTGAGLDTSSAEHEISLTAQITPSATKGKLPGIYRDLVRLTILPTQ